MRCERCGQETTVTTGSYFNTDQICTACDDAERAHPRFEEARQAEEAACRAGDYNFPGIGLPSDLAPTK